MQLDYPHSQQWKVSFADAETQDAAQHSDRGARKPGSPSQVTKRAAAPAE